MHIKLQQTDGAQKKLKPRRGLECKSASAPRKNAHHSVCVPGHITKAGNIWMIQLSVESHEFSQAYYVINE